MGLLSFLRTVLFNVGALGIAYILLLSGVHKFTYKIWGLTLSESLYRSLDKFYLIATREGYKHLDAFISTHDLPTVPHLHAQTWKSLVGAFELLLAFMWMTTKWRRAAWGSVCVMVSWIAIGLSDWLPNTSSASSGSGGVDDNISFAAFFLGLSFFCLWIGPPGARRAPAAVAGGKKRR